MIIILSLKSQQKSFFKKSTCLGKNTKKYISFAVPIEEEVAKVEKNGEEVTEYISYILQFIGSARSMASSLSNLVNNLSEINHKIKCKHRHEDKKCQTCGIKYNYCNFFHEYTNLKDDVIETFVL